MRDPENVEPNPEDIEVIGPGVGSAQVIVPGVTPPTIDEPGAHENTEDVDKSTIESIESDRGLLDPESAEFEHLTKPPQLSEQQLERPWTPQPASDSGSKSRRSDQKPGEGS